MVHLSRRGRRSSSMPLCGGLFGLHPTFLPCSHRQKFTITTWKPTGSFHVQRLCSVLSLSIVDTEIYCCRGSRWLAQKSGYPPPRLSRYPPQIESTVRVSALDDGHLLGSSQVNPPYFSIILTYSSVASGSSRTTIGKRSLAGPGCSVITAVNQT